jgi:TfoX C-terminal domain
MSSESVRELSNIGAQTATWLEAVGVKTLEDIEKLGVVEVYERLKLAYPKRCHSMHCGHCKELF